MNGMSLRNSLRPTAIGDRTADNARTTSKLKLLEPTTLPRAIAECPSRAAIMLTTSSGADVPTETTVSPTTNSETPMPRAILLAPLTTLLPPVTSKANPTTMSAQSTNVPPPVKRYSNAVPSINTIMLSII